MKQFGIIFRYLWICLLVWLGGMTLFLCPKEERLSERENRMLAGAPSFSMASVLDGTFMTGIGDWLSDGIVLRDQLIAIGQTVRTAFAFPTEEAGEDEEALQIIAAIEEETDGQEEQNQYMSETQTTSLESDYAPGLEPAVEAEEQEETALETAEQEKDSEVEETVSVQEPAETDLHALSAQTEKEPLKDTTFWIRYEDGRVKTLYTFPASNVQNAASILNQYRALLPEDGNVIYACIPVSSTGNVYISERDIRECWASDMEDELQKAVSDGVHIVNASAVILPALERGEYVYFRTDHHWTALGAHYIYTAMMERLGIPAMAYHDYEYHINRGMGKGGANSDTIEVIREILPVHSYVVRHLDQLEEVPYMYPNFKGYVAYLGGTRTPWRRFDTGSQTGRNALLIGDSFSNALLPYLLPHYDRVIMTDLRSSYYNSTEAGASISAYIERYHVDDVYFMYCFATSINSTHFRSGQLTRYLY